MQRSTRRDFGLPEDSFIYCCLNNNYKITSEIFESWLQILERTDNSLLLLLADNDDAKQSLSDRASFRGLGKRLAFTDRLPTAEYLQLLGVCGVFLDTFPYNAHTTGADALHANLPILTIAGHTFPSRVSASMIKRIGLAADDSQQMARQLEKIFTDSIEEHRSNF